jgi:hypothetical protein
MIRIENKDGVNNWVLEGNPEHIAQFYLLVVSAAKAVGYTEATINKWFPREDIAIDMSIDISEGKWPEEKDEE